MRELTQTRQAVGIAMFDLEREIKREGRLRTVTGAIFERMTVGVSSGAGYVVGRLETDDYWKYVGSGRGPGGMPPVGRLAEWVQRAGIAVSPWAIAKSIAKHGSRDFRLKKPNVFTSSIDKWEQGPALDELEEASGKELEDAAVEVVKTLGRNG